MADGETQVTQIQAPAPTGPSLKYLEFVPFVVAKIATYVTTFYEYGKDSSGPLKSGVDSVEGTVKTVVGPVYHKYENKPYDLLVFVDGKVDGLAHFLDGHLPEKVKETSVQALDLAKGTVSDVQTRGFQATAKNYYDKYEPVAESVAVKVYKKAITFPLVPQAVSVTRFFALKVNDVVLVLKNNGLPLAGYLPLLPVSYFDKITKTE